MEDDSMGRQQARMRELEMAIGLLAAAFGLSGGNQWRLRLSIDKAFELRKQLGTGPIVMFSCEDDYYVIDVLKGYAA